MRRTPLRKKSKTEGAKLKQRLWELCRLLIKKLYPHTCFTCGKELIPGRPDFHTGHFISSSICSTELRYDLANLRPQCSGCNLWKSGNWIAFEQNLIRDHGSEYVIELKKRNQATKGLKYDELWYKAKIAEYEALLEQTP